MGRQLVESTFLGLAFSRIVIPSVIVSTYRNISTLTYKTQFTLHCIVYTIQYVCVWEGDEGGWACGRMLGFFSGIGGWGDGNGWRGGGMVSVLDL